MITTIGIDFSVSSPGICIYDGRYHFYFFAKRKREIGISIIRNKYTITAWNYPEYETREERYDKICTKIEEEILKYLGITGAYEPYQIGIEGYSYASQGQGVSVAYEGGAVIRHKLFKSDLQFTEYPPTVIKKAYCGKGNAGKELMYLQFESEGLVDFYEELGFKSKGSKVPNPIEDLCDAYAIVQMMMGIKKNPVNPIKNLIKLI